MFKLGYQKENIVHNEIVRLNGTGFRKHLRANNLLYINMLYKITQPTRVDVEARDVNILIYSKCIACKKGAGGWEWNSWALSWQREILTSMSPVSPSTRHTDTHGKVTACHYTSRNLSVQAGALSQTFMINESHA